MICKNCNYPGCINLISRSETYCQEHKIIKRQNYDLYERQEYSKMYHSVAWRKKRLLFLKANPLCVHCYELGKVIPATVVDHIVDHKGDNELFWNDGNYQALCVNCHNRKTLNNK